MKYFLTKIGIYLLWGASGALAAKSGSMFSWWTLPAIAFAFAGFAWYDLTWERHRRHP